MKLLTYLLYTFIIALVVVVAVLLLLLLSSAFSGESAAPDEAARTPPEEWCICSVSIAVRATRRSVRKLGWAAGESNSGESAVCSSTCARIYAFQ